MSADLPADAIRDVIAQAIQERLGGEYVCVEYLVCASCEKVDKNEPTFHSLGPIGNTQSIQTGLGLLAAGTVVESKAMWDSEKVGDDEDDKNAY